MPKPKPKFRDRRPLPDQNTLSRAGRAVAKLMSSITSSAGQDCLLHAKLLHHLLSVDGVSSSITIGHAAWRYGPESGAVVAHVPNLAVMSKGNFAGHAWIEIDRWIILDATLWSLPAKIAILNSIDPQRTTNRWNFPVLLAKKAQVNSFERVRDGHGLAAFFQREALLEAEMLPKLPELDPHLLTALGLIYRNPEVQVIGL